MLGRVYFRNISPTLVQSYLNKKDITLISRCLYPNVSQRKKSNGFTWLQVVFPPFGHYEHFLQQIDRNAMKSSKMFLSTTKVASRYRILLSNELLESFVFDIWACWMMVPLKKRQWDFSIGYLNIALKKAPWPTNIYDTDMSFSAE